MSASATYFKWSEKGDDDEGNRQSLLYIIMCQVLYLISTEINSSYPHINPVR